jgi:hypothetical protein
MLLGDAAAACTPPDDETWMKTIVPLSAGMIAVMALSFAMYRGSSAAADKARRRFAASMNEVASRLGIAFRPASDALDWAGAIGDYRGRRVALFIVSQTERPMQTGVSVALRDASVGRLAAIRQLRSRKLHVEAPSSSEGAANLAPETAAGTKRLLDGVDAVKIDSRRIVVLATGKSSFWQGFFEYRMETDAERLVRIVDQTVDLADALD